jgi:hypothetical protein
MPILDTYAINQQVDETIIEKESRERGWVFSMRNALLSATLLAFTSHASVDVCAHALTISIWSNSYATTDP